MCCDVGRESKPARLKMELDTLAEVFPTLDREVLAGFLEDNDGNVAAATEVALQLCSAFLVLAAPCVTASLVVLGPGTSAGTQS